MEFSGDQTTRAVSANLMPLALLGIFLIFFHSTFTVLMQRWTKWDESLSHGLIVNAVFVYLLSESLPWQVATRTSLQKIFALVLLCLLSLAWFVFHLISISILEQLSLLALLVALYIGCYGLKNVFSHRLLLLLPLFSLPIWDGMTDSLVSLSSVMVGGMIKLVNLPAMIEGNSITIPAGQIIIADGCSGIRYFQISLALAFIIALMNTYTEKRLLLTLGVAALIGLAANWIRIFIIVMVGYYTEMQSSLMHDHEYFGWALFAVIMLPAIYFAPAAKMKTKSTRDATTPDIPMVVLTLLALATGPTLSQLVTLDPTPLPFNTVFTEKVTSANPADMPVQVTHPLESYTQNGFFETAHGKLYLQVDRYQRKHAKDKLVPYFARLFNYKEWVATQQTITIAGQAVTLTQLINKHDERLVLQAQWFQVGDFTTESVAKAKLLQIPTLLSGAEGFGIFTAQTVCEEISCDQARARITENLSSVFTSFSR